MASGTSNYFEPTTDQPPAGLNVRRVQVGDKFSKTVELRTAVERCFRADGRGCRADVRVTGSRTKLYRCDGAVYDLKNTDKEERRKTTGCQALVRACMQMKTLEWKVTAAHLSHVNCSGGERKAGIRVLLPEAEAIVNSNTSISADALTKTLKGQTNFGNMSARTANRLRSLIRTGGRQEADETYMRVADYLRQLKALSGGSVTDCQVCAS